MTTDWKHLQGAGNWCLFSPCDCKQATHTDAGRRPSARFTLECMPLHNLRTKSLHSISNPCSQPLDTEFDGPQCSWLRCRQEDQRKGQDRGPQQPCRTGMGGETSYVPAERSQLLGLGEQLTGLLFIKTATASWIKTNLPF